MQPPATHGVALAVPAVSQAYVGPPVPSSPSPDQSWAGAVQGVAEELLGLNRSNQENEHPVLQALAAHRALAMSGKGGSARPSVAALRAPSAPSSSAPTPTPVSAPVAAAPIPEAAAPRPSAPTRVVTGPSTPSMSSGGRVM